MKTIIISDLHGNGIWRRIVDTEKFDCIIFIGDYFDSFNVDFLHQLENFESILEFKKKREEEVVFLLGNHDFHYLPGVGERYSGFQENYQYIITDLFQKNLDKFQIAYSFENVLCTHAGVSEGWLAKTHIENYDNLAEDINEVFKTQMYKFKFDGYDPYGNDKTQSPIWIRPESLIKNSRNIRKKFIQVVGHTPQEKIDLKAKHTGGNYIFIDVFDTINQYLIHENGEFRIGEIEERRRFIG